MTLKADSIYILYPYYISQFWPLIFKSTSSNNYTAYQTYKILSFLSKIEVLRFSLRSSKHGNILHAVHKTHASDNTKYHCIYMYFSLISNKLFILQRNNNPELRLNILIANLNLRSADGANARSIEHQLLL
jgi:hypothetical protein